MLEQAIESIDTIHIINETQIEFVQKVNDADMDSLNSTPGQNKSDISEILYGDESMISEMTEKTGNTGGSGGTGGTSCRARR